MRNIDTMIRDIQIALESAKQLKQFNCLDEYSLERENTEYRIECALERALTNLRRENLCETPLALPKALSQDDLEDLI